MSDRGCRQVVVIAGWDPSGGAGLIRDLWTLHRLGVPASGVVAALTTQDSNARGRVEPVSSSVTLAQLKSACPAGGKPVLKIGMLYSRANIEVVAQWIERHPPHAVVLDPVLESKGGLKLATEDAVRAYISLIRLATVATPNLLEARKLLAPNSRPGRTGPRVAAMLLHRMGARHILLKLPATRHSKIDLHFDGDRYVEFENRHPSRHEVRGSGCALATAIAAFLARGQTPGKAIKSGLLFVRNSFARTRPAGRSRFFS